MRCKEIRPDGAQCALAKGHEGPHDPYALLLSGSQQFLDEPGLGPLVYTLNEEQSEEFMYHMTRPKPPTPSMIEAARKMREWKERPGRLEYESWNEAFDKD